LFLEFNWGLHEKTPDPAKPRVIFSHLPFEDLPEQVREKKVKVIYLERNPKDTMVSFYNHVHGMKGFMGYEGSWTNFYDLLMSFGVYYGDWFDYVLQWEKTMAAEEDVPIFTSPFEALKKDPVGQIAKLDEFLGFKRSQELYEQIADACSFSKLKKAKEGDMPELLKSKIFKAGKSFYRKGEVGDWKNWFTVAQDERFNAAFANRMAASKLTYRFVQ